MITRMSAAVIALFALLAFTGCMATNAEPAPSSAVPASPGNSPLPPITTVAPGEIPAAFLTGIERVFPQDDLTGMYEGAKFHCLALDSNKGDFDAAGKGLILDVPMTADQAIGFMELSVKYACPKWREAFDSWANSGGRDRLTAIAPASQ